jgi:hypothetical protein
MEFGIDSDNIQIIVKNIKKDKNDSSGVSPRSDSDLFDLSGNNTINYEILLKLEDYYLINNIKLKGDIDELIIHKIKFQSVKNGLWENVPYYNPDKNEITVRENE